MARLGVASGADTKGGSGIKLIEHESEHGRFGGRRKEEEKVKKKRKEKKGMRSRSGREKGSLKGGRLPKVERRSQGNPQIARSVSNSSIAALKPLPSCSDCC